MQGDTVIKKQDVPHYMQRSLVRHMKLNNKSHGWIWNMIRNLIKIIVRILRSNFISKPESIYTCFIIWQQFIFVITISKWFLIKLYFYTLKLSKYETFQKK